MKVLRIVIDDQISANIGKYRQISSFFADIVPIRGPSPAEPNSGFFERVLIIDDPYGGPKRGLKQEDVPYMFPSSPRQAAIAKIKRS
jgi:hypothetical protein